MCYYYSILLILTVAVILSRRAKYHCLELIMLSKMSNETFRTNEVIKYISIKEKSNPTTNKDKEKIITNIPNVRIKRFFKFIISPLCLFLIEIISNLLVSF